MSGYFKLITNLQLVRGSKRSAIYDLQRSTYKIISNELYDFIKLSNEKSIAIERLKGRSLNFVKFLLMNEYIFICKNKTELSYFPPLAIQYQFPGVISTLVLEDPTPEIIQRISSLALNLNIPFLQILVFCQNTVNTMESILMALEGCPFRSIEIILPYNDNCCELSSSLIKRFSNIALILFYGSIKSTSTFSASVIRHTAKTASQIRNGQIENETYFSCNISLFMEAKFFNPYVNGKLYICMDGLIKNAAEFSEGFGNILCLNDDEMLSLIMSKNFQSYWDVTKDMIDVCRECEFRYMCTDNRIPVQISPNLYRHKTECNYNPHSGKWKGEPLD